MSNLANILVSTSNHLSLPDSNASELANQNGGSSDFDDVMSHAMAPRAAGQNSAINSRIHSAGPLQFPNHPKTEDDLAAAGDVTSDASQADTTGSSQAAHKVRASSKEAQSADTTLASVEPDDFSNIPIQFLAPTLAELLLRPTAAPVPSTGGATTAVAAANLTIDSANPAEATEKTSVQEGVNQPAAGKPTTKISANETASQTETGRKISAALKDLGLQPNASAKLVATETAPNANSIDGANLTTTKNDLPATVSTGDVNTGASIQTQAAINQTLTADKSTDKSGSSETAGQTEAGKIIPAALTIPGLQPDVSVKIVSPETNPNANAGDDANLTLAKNDQLVTDAGKALIPGVSTLIQAVAGQAMPMSKPAAKAGTNETATAADTVKKTAGALKGLGLQPDASVEVAPIKTASNADNIAGANLTTAKSDLPASDTDNRVNAGVLTKTEPQAALFSNGTTAAKDEIPMKKAETTNQSTDQTEKVLPGQNVSSARMSNLLHASSASDSPNDQPMATNIIPLSSAVDRNANATGNSDPVTVANLSDIQARAMERTHDMVTNNALRLASTQSDTMQVVLKPGAGTELSLELRQRGGVIEAQAVLQHGDYQNLSQHWPDLQQRLEQKGIKLAALTSDESSLPFNGNQGNSKNQESSEREALFASAFAEFSLAGVMHAASATPIVNTVRNGFETWA